ncbi:helix-turn-helix domain-containing protein [Intestinimonas massiliensis (ex Afouda et al. 2020)]|uniref:helix-turn-helix domain-containing protein n=1 Tax=Intestinimonas massiliensis (ex Afouda et al. 2020) TaxID=1673721 RepID=UPI00067F551F|nr:helix-turn-helix domain-containing protein [Intestinimonas massiliensis (ex Afouda et al. 2020)]
MNRIKVLRLERNIKQVDLAKAVSVSQAALSGYETGKYEPDFDTLKRIAEYFDVSIDYLLGGKLDSRANASATEDDIKAAFWGGDRDLSAEDMDAMWADVKNFAAFVAQRKKQEKRRDE